MVSVVEIRSLAERLAKAEALVAARAVYPVAGLEEGYYVVQNGGGDQFYLVRLKDDGGASCSCPDFTQRQGKVEQPCKHILAAELVTLAPPPATAPKAKAAATSTKPARGAALARLQADEDPYPMPPAPWDGAPKEAAR